MKAAIYARCSTSHHDQNPDVQLRELKRYCNARNWTIAHEIIDHGYSGGSEQRPGLKRLLGVVKRREVDAVVVVKLDRFFRSLRHLVVTLEEFAAMGVVFVATADNLDYSTPSGKFFVQVLGSLAEFEKALLRERTILGLEHARAIGRTLGRPKKRDDVAIWKLRAEGHSYSQIQTKLNLSKGAVCRALSAAPKTHRRSTDKSSTKLGSAYAKK